MALSTDKFMEAPALPIRFVLLNPHNPDNLGAAARALKNFGFSEWSVVGLNNEFDLNHVRRVAVHAQDLIDNIQRVDRLDDAIQDCAFVTGTSSRHVQGREFLTPEMWAEKAADVAQRKGRIALVFGEERSGMSNQEIQRCHALSGIPTLPEQPSLNLAQAILLYAYEARRAAISRHKLTQPPERQPELCTDETLRRLEGLVRQLAQASGFSGRHGQDAPLIRDLMSPLIRARLCLREGRLVEALLRNALKALGTGNSK